MGLLRIIFQKVLLLGEGTDLSASDTMYDEASFHLPFCASLLGYRGSAERRVIQHSLRWKVRAA